ncbi:MAG: hypothetical protein N4A72_15310 [Bacteroidales bacterium]|jgi:hypothetical protein|nr:hypothetical protein [Bacteroidales bacterium]
MKIFKKRLDTQIVIAFGVMLVSFSTLFVTMYQASIMNKQNDVILKQTKANAWPCLIVEKTELGDKLSPDITKYLFSISNKGTGPAIIRGVRVKYKDTVVKSWREMFAVMQIPDSIPLWRTYSLISRSVISANESLTMIDISDNPKLAKYMINNGKDINVEIIYKSVFDELWMVERTLGNNASTYPVKVSKCTIPENEMFEN